MGYVFDFKDADLYDAGFDKPGSQYRLELEIRLILGLMDPKKGERILDIGCGTGISLVPLLDRGLNLTGIDASPYMLDKAHDRLGDRVDLHRGIAEDLPFEDNAFDTALLFTSLEFTDRPAKAIEEACRVAKDRVVIGVLNRYAPLNMARRIRGFFSPDVYSKAHFFSIGEVKQMLFSILGNVPVLWRTTLQFPFLTGRVVSYIENIRLVQKSYYGTMIGMRIKPVPKFRTRPLALKIQKRKAYKPTPGMATRQFIIKN
ncbi:class I SAM-dependent methyltransferase [Desulfospira joergensenii]|uniref:class I SAM-dependent methyltransferase n=1 Tax=Desulfospira joergensenii TaxID=53329 RepID=UPI0003B631E6|nr:class I SAM-dependent methyltransferase [Desulfospira joergensenii]